MLNAQKMILERKHQLNIAVSSNGAFFKNKLVHTEPQMFLALLEFEYFLRESDLLERRGAVIARTQRHI